MTICIDLLCRSVIARGRNSPSASRAIGLLDWHRVACRENDTSPGFIITVASSLRGSRKKNSRYGEHKHPIH